jgi:hypothetical protein
MVAVCVSDYEGVDVGEFEAARGEADLHLSMAEACVNEQASARGLDDSGVSPGTAGKYTEFERQASPLTYLHVWIARHQGATTSRKSLPGMTRGKLFRCFSTYILHFP